MASVQQGATADDVRGTGEAKRRLQPSGFDMMPATSSNAVPSERIVESLPAKETTAALARDDESTQAQIAADAFQRQIPALKKKPDVPAILAGLDEVAATTLPMMLA